MMEVTEILNLLREKREEDVDLISRAFEFAKKVHEGVKRASGEDYTTHPVETAKTLARSGLDVPTIVAGLLHDVLEDGDTGTTENTIRKEFGDEILFLVQGVTKLGKLKYRGEERRIENLRKMFLAMAEDIRVILIRLADRLHNMKTLEYLPPEKQKRIALETLEIYAPLAKRLGMGKMNSELEDLAFLHLFREDYLHTKELLKTRYQAQEKILARVKYKLKEELEKNGLEILAMDSRVKHLYSLYKKLREPERDMDIREVYDLIALRVIVKTVEDCYRTLGIIHQMWKPYPGRIKDYIALPKLNGYQSLHTTVFALDGNITEIQIRTEKMHHEAEYGIAAHWAYSESGKPKAGARINPKLSWVNQLLELQRDAKQSSEFLDSLRIDFFKDRVFCFTPKGDVIDLPEGATAIDFAYAIHSDIGNSAVGAIINHKFVGLDTVLKNTDIVEIKTQKNKKPNPEWLRNVRTSLAKKHIRGAIYKEKLKNLE